MSDTLWITNGHIIDPANKRDGPGEIFAKNGKIVDSLSTPEKQTAKKIDAQGMVVCPGLVDTHVHFRFPGQTHKENIQTGSHAAAAGGVTTVVCMPNTTPAADNPGTIQRINDAAKRESIVHLYTTGTLTKNREGKELAPIGTLKESGVIAVTDDGDCIQDNEIMRRAAEYAHMFNLPILDHCQDEALTRDAVMNEGEWSLKLGLRGWPNSAEDLIVSRNVILSAYTGAHIHMQHLTSTGAVEIMRNAKAQGINVSCEVTPHHLALTDACLSDYNPNFKMNPPLRTEADRQALIAGLLDGTIDIIATDHAPHTDYEKEVELDNAPFGILGLETLLPVCVQTLVHSSLCSLPFLISRLTDLPSKLFDLPKGTLTPGSDADITIFDPNATWTYSEDKIFSRSKNSPWVGEKLTGKVHYTFVSGKMAYDGERVLS